jgi:glycine/D-amino acid oxidase-like deaminating enzyme
MTRAFDAIIIGAGISGAAIAYELSKKGYRTINVDRLAAAGQGSTSNTCAIIRTHYSTLEGTAIAYDSWFAWKDWNHYLYKNGPAIGLVLSEIINACENGHDHDRNPVEVKLRNIDFTLNTGIFSRNRDVIEGSSFSVLG